MPDYSCKPRNLILFVLSINDGRIDFVEEQYNIIVAWFGSNNLQISFTHENLPVVDVSAVVVVVSAGVVVVSTGVVVVSCGVVVVSTWVE